MAHPPHSNYFLDRVEITNFSTLYYFKIFLTHYENSVRKSFLQSSTPPEQKWVVLKLKPIIFHFKFIPVHYQHIQGQIMYKAIASKSEFWIENESLSCHSSEKRSLCLMKSFSEVLQNLPYFRYTKTQSCCFHFSFHATLFFSLCRHRPRQEKIK